MAEYTPTTNGVLTRYAFQRARLFSPDSPERDRARSEFDRWLAEIKADAWDEGVNHAHTCGIGERMPNPYRAAGTTEAGDE